MATAGLMKENIVDGPSGPGGTKRKNEGATTEAAKNKPRRRMGGKMPQRVAKGTKGLSSSTAAAAGAESEEAASLRGRSAEGDADKQSGTVSVYEDSAAAPSSSSRGGKASSSKSSTKSSTKDAAKGAASGKAAGKGASSKSKVSFKMPDYMSSWDAEGDAARRASKLSSVAETPKSSRSSRRRGAADADSSMNSSRASTSSSSANTSRGSHGGSEEDDEVFFKNTDATPARPGSRTPAHGMGRGSGQGSGSGSGGDGGDDEDGEDGMALDMDLEQDTIIVPMSTSLQRVGTRRSARTAAKSATKAPAAASAYSTQAIPAFRGGGKKRSRNSGSLVAETGTPGLRRGGHAQAIAASNESMESSMSSPNVLDMSGMDEASECGSDDVTDHSRLDVSITGDPNAFAGSDNDETMDMGALTAIAALPSSAMSTRSQKKAPSSSAASSSSSAASSSSSAASSSSSSSSSSSARSSSRAGRSSKKGQMAPPSHTPSQHPQHPQHPRSNLQLEFARQGGLPGGLMGCMGGNGHKFPSSTRSDGSLGSSSSDGDAGETLNEFLGGKVDWMHINQKPLLKMKMIGRGGSAKVYKVLGSDYKVYAVKKIKLHKVDAVSLSNYENEIDLLLRLRGCQNIITMVDYEVDVRNKTILLQMEHGEADFNSCLQQKYCKDRAPLKAGADVSAWTSKGAFFEPLVDENFIRMYWQQMLEGVNSIHEARIVHGDLKPANFLSVQGVLKLIDFGIAKALTNDTTHISRDAQMGTLNYMSPESISAPSGGAHGAGPKQGRPSDIWALGCILYQMVYGRTFCVFGAVLGERSHAVCWVCECECGCGWIVDTFVE